MTGGDAAHRRCSNGAQCRSRKVGVTGNGPGHDERETPTGYERCSDERERDRREEATRAGGRDGPDRSFRPKLCLEARKVPGGGDKRCNLLGDRLRPQDGCGTIFRVRDLAGSQPKLG